MNKNTFKEYIFNFKEKSRKLREDKVGQNRVSESAPFNSTKYFSLSVQGKTFSEWKDFRLSSISYPLGCSWLQEEGCYVWSSCPQTGHWIFFGGGCWSNRLCVGGYGWVGVVWEPRKIHTHRRRSSTRPSGKSIGSGGQVSWRIPRFRSASGIPWKIPSPCGRSCRSPHATLFLSLTRTPRSDLDPRMASRKGSGAASLHARATRPVRGKVARMPSADERSIRNRERAPRAQLSGDRPPPSQTLHTHPPTTLYRYTRRHFWIPKTIHSIYESTHTVSRDLPTEISQVEKVSRYNESLPKDSHSTFFPRLNRKSLTTKLTMY